MYCVFLGLVRGRGEGGRGGEGEEEEGRVVGGEGSRGSLSKVIRQLTFSAIRGIYCTTTAPVAHD